jgi:hypothetical protein
MAAMKAKTPAELFRDNFKWLMQHPAWIGEVYES